MAARTTTFVASLSLFISLLVSASAAAAPPSTGGSGPEQEACSGRSAGDACTLPNNQLGTCAASTCNRLDYSGGSPPKSIEEPCVICQAPGGQPHDGPPMLGGDGGEGGSEPADSGSKSDEEAATSSKEPPPSASRCRVTDEEPNPAGLALVGLVLFCGRRRAARRRQTVSR
jgi:MYXO-CTERM domain-containing protein